MANPTDTWAKVVETVELHHAKSILLYKFHQISTTNGTMDTGDVWRQLAMVMVFVHTLYNAIPTDQQPMGRVHPNVHKTDLCMLLKSTKWHQTKATANGSTSYTYIYRSRNTYRPTSSCHIPDKDNLTRSTQAPDWPANYPTPTQWDNKLWSNIKVQTCLPDLYQQITSGQLITIHSNAAMNPNHDSSFAWLIVTDIPIWQGEGAVPGPVKDAHTGRSKAYGLLMALQFLAHYLQHFLMTYHLTRTMVAYCDNSGTVSRIESLLKEKQQLTSSTIMDDYDVCEEIAQAMWRLRPIRVQYLHIKGHQDRKIPVHKLTKQAQYNVNSNRRAADTLPNLAPYSTSRPTYPMPGAYPHLVIQRKVVVRALQGALRHAAITPAYRMYMQKKFTWKTTDAEEVNWNTLTMMLKHFPKDHNQIAKLIHEWLPLQGSFNVEASPAMLCPQCLQAHEDSWHFLECKDPERQKLFNQLHRDLQQIHTNNSIDPYLFQLLWQGLLWIRTDTDINEQLQDYPTQYKPLFERQRAIGWEPLYYGQIAVTWAHFIDSTTNGKTSGMIFYSRVIKLIWQYLLLVWTARNSTLHPPTPSNFTTAQLKQQVEHLLHTAKQDPHYTLSGGRHTKWPNYATNVGTH